jgi:hypothetical protein
MTTEDLQEWLTVKGKKDIWWMQINGKTLGQKVTLGKIEEISVKNPNSEVSVLHISQQTLRPRPWVEVEFCKPTANVAPSPVRTVSGEKFGSLPTKKLVTSPKTSGSYVHQHHPAPPAPPAPSAPPNSSGSKKSKKGGIGGLLSTLLIGAFFIILGRACGSKIGGDLAKERIKSERRESSRSFSKTAAPPSVSQLTYYEVAGLRVKLPARPQSKTMQIPAQAMELLESTETHVIEEGSTMISVSKVVYKGSEANLDGAAAGSIDEVKAQPGVRIFTSSKDRVIVSGLEGWSINMNYKNSGVAVNHYALALVRGNEMWQLQVIGVREGNRQSMENLKEAIFGSVELQ